MATCALVATVFTISGLSGQSLVADYRFDNSLSSAPGTIAPTLELIGSPAFQIETVDGALQTVLGFPKGSGCRIPGASEIIDSTYTIVVLFRMDENTSWRRLIDFQNRKTDWGLYSYYGNLNYYNIITGSGGAIAVDEYVQVALTRNAQGTMRGYVNGLPEIDFNDVGNSAVVDADDLLSFFQDDLVVANEHSAGAVSRIRIWNGALGAEEIAALDRSFTGLSVAPPVINSALEISLEAGTELDYTVTASGNPISFSATDLEDWMTFDALTGKFTGTAGDPGVYQVPVAAFNAGGAGGATLTITVLPVSGSSLGFEISSARVRETAGILELAVLRKGSTDGTAEVGFATETETEGAVAEEDFVAASGVLRFADGEAEKRLEITILYDSAAEPDEVFFVRLENPTNAEIAAPARLRIVIEDVPVGSPDAGIEPAVLIKWPSLPGVNYRVLYAESPGTWMVLQDGIVGDGSEIIVFDELHDPRRLYKVEATE